MSTWRICALAALVGSLGGCQGNGGAVSVRWRIIDLSTGEGFDPSANSGANGFCCLQRTQNVCNADNIWIVQTVGITLTDPVTGESPVHRDGFPCSEREVTTPFDLPTGTFAISLTAEIFSGTGMRTPGVLPPPQVDTIVSGDVVNLQVIEISVQPLPVAGAVVPLPGAAPMVTF
jgi:hypothetical protein